VQNSAIPHDQSNFRGIVWRLKEKAGAVRPADGLSTNAAQPEAVTVPKC